MKLTTLFLLFLFLSPAAFSAPRCDGTLAKIFGKPFIVGASISAGEGIEDYGGPGNRASILCTAKPDIRNIAVSGKAGADFVEDGFCAEEEDGEEDTDEGEDDDDSEEEEEEEEGKECGGLDAQLEGRTIVIALDYLFWDSALNRNVNNGIDALNTLMQATKKKGLPIILGNIPKMKFGQWNSGALNVHIKSACDGYSKCHLVDLVDLKNQISGDGYSFEGRNYELDDVMQDDGLHFNKTGSDVVGKMLIELVKRGRR